MPALRLGVLSVVALLQGGGCREGLVGPKPVPTSVKPSYLHAHEHTSRMSGRLQRWLWLDGRAPMPGAPSGPLFQPTAWDCTERQSGLRAATPRKKGATALLQLRGGHSGKGPHAGGQTKMAPRKGDIVVKRRVFKERTGWHPVKSSAPYPAEWSHPPPPHTVSCSVICVLDRLALALLPHRVPQFPFLWCCSCMRLL